MQFHQNLSLCYPSPLWLICHGTTSRVFESKACMMASLRSPILMFNSLYSLTIKQYYLLLPEACIVAVNLVLAYDADQSMIVDKLRHTNKTVLELCKPVEISLAPRHIKDTRAM